MKKLKKIIGLKVDDSHCRWCQEPISDNAVVCQKCRGHQNLLWNYISQSLFLVSIGISILMLVISIINVSIANKNLDEAKQKRIEATKALTIAERASKVALNAKDTALKAQSLVNDLSLMADANAAAISAPNNISSLRKLWNISQTNNNRARVVAARQLEPILRTIKSEYEMVNSPYWHMTNIDDPRYFGFDNMKGWKRKEYINNYLKVPDDRRIVYVAKFLADNKENNEEKFAFCYSALQVETIPEVIYTICAFVNTKAKLNKDYLFDIDYYKAWLKKRIPKDIMPQ